MTNHLPVPEYNSIHTWELYSAELGVEFMQSTEEGLDVAGLKPLFDAISALPRSAEKEQLADILFRMICRAPTVEGYPYTEPSDLDQIRTLRPAGVVLGQPTVTEEKVRGAWVGRICGCLLGKPIEGIRFNELTEVLKATGNLPMTRYIRSDELSDALCSRIGFPLRGRCYADTVDRMPADDDTNYTALAQLLISRYGRSFTPAQMAEHWLNCQSKNAYCTAERVAFRNFIDGYRPPESAMYKNPYREWIGAQIRADYFGYICPGDPQTAAEYAWRDASISHIKNGIYGEMWVAAMLAAAYCTDDMETIIRAGLAQIPEKCRLAEKINAVLDAWKAGQTADEWFADFHNRYDDHNGHLWCHTITNAEICAAALLWGSGDYAKSVCLAVQNGFDTDCNGATVGSVVGLVRGIDAIGEEWYAPINDTLNTTIFGVGDGSVTRMVEKTLEHIHG